MNLGISELTGIDFFLKERKRKNKIIKYFFNSFR